MKIATDRFTRLPLVNPTADAAKAAKLSAHDVRVAFVLNGNTLHAQFRVALYYRPNTLPDLKGQGPHWGLWEGDVVELFLRVGDSHYFEFQVSPLGQDFELKVIEPKTNVDREFRSGMLAKTEHRAWAGEWDTSMEIDLTRLGWQGDRTTITGNAFAILGKGEPRMHYGLNLPPQEKPDFHLPEHFKKLPGI